MKSIFKAFTVALVAATMVLGSAPAQAEDPVNLGIDLGGKAQADYRNGGFGLGIVLGNPSGVSAKWWLNKTNALQFGANFNFNHDSFGFNVDYLLHFDIGTKATGFDLPFYLGLGAWMNLGGKDNNNIQMGVHVPVGIAMCFRKVSVDVFLEVTPGIRFIDDIDFNIGANIGARYYF